MRCHLSGSYHVSIDDNQSKWTRNRPLDYFRGQVSLFVVYRTSQAELLFVCVAQTDGGGLEGADIELTMVVRSDCVPARLRGKLAGCRRLPVDLPGI